jgi:hypothetical protein
MLANLVVRDAVSPAWCVGDSKSPPSTFGVRAARTAAFVASIPRLSIAGASGLGGKTLKPPIPPVCVDTIWPVPDERPPFGKMPFRAFMAASALASYRLTVGPDSRGGS